MLTGTPKMLRCKHGGSRVKLSLRIHFGHEKHKTGPHRMAEPRPEEKIYSQILRSRPGVWC